jgi:hypothetical protein
MTKRAPLASFQRATKRDRLRYYRVDTHAAKISEDFCSLGDFESLAENTERRLQHMNRRKVILAILIGLLLATTSLPALAAEPTPPPPPKVTPQPPTPEQLGQARDVLKAIGEALKDAQKALKEARERLRDLPKKEQVKGLHILRQAQEALQQTMKRATDAVTHIVRQYRAGKITAEEALAKLGTIRDKSIERIHQIKERALVAIDKLVQES